MELVSGFGVIPPFEVGSMVTPPCCGVLAIVCSFAVGPIANPVAAGVGKTILAYYRSSRF